MAYCPGINAAVLIGSTTYSFDKWDADIGSTLPDVTNFTSSGYQLVVAGIKAGKFEVSGPYNQGSMAFTQGNTYTILLSWDGMNNLSNPGVLETIHASQDVRDAGRVKLTFKTSGAFTAAIT